MQEPVFINGLSQIADKYPSYIIDLWGVLHDGVSAYPEAIETLKKLKEKNKKIVLLSNAPRRSSAAKQTLDRLGFTENLYDNLLTSGEATFDYVRTNYAGAKYFYIGPEKDRNIFDDLDLEEVLEATNAKFALATGFDGFGSVFEEKKAKVDEALKADLILLCANPDYKVVKQTGEEQICAGLIAKYYEEKGGQVIYFGKPYEPVYKKCLELLGTKKPAEILCIGDSIHTDILGGNNFGSSTLFVAGGIHKNDFVENGYMNLSKFKVACDDGKIFPNYVIKEFFW